MPSWSFWGSKPKPEPPSPLDDLPKLRYRTVQEVIPELKTRFDAHVFSLPPHTLIASTFVLSSAFTLGARHVYTRYFRRIRSTEWVTPDMLGTGRWYKGYVVKCVDYLIFLCSYHQLRLVFVEQSWR